MKVAVRALLLLWCGLAVLADNTEVAATKSTEDTDHAADIHAVLRKMSGLLAESRAELRCAKSKLEDMETRLTASEDRAEGLENTVEELRRTQAERVSFSASLLVSAHGHTGPINPPPILVYKHVITNIGNRYNPNTGIFTAPVKGVYNFLAFVHGGGAGHGTGVVLHKNGDPIVSAYAHQRSLSVNSSNGVSLLLEVGDVVYVKLFRSAWAFDSSDHHTTFSGYLLFPYQGSEPVLKG
ncbi:complement C1q-like protein 2 [Engraulis encrasicolus]|uniref:complement C1q-like protein 2 n=1 Tax=Engraulis encrasicolus TaxID=184585 RepID=UPI002FD141E0